MSCATPPQGVQGHKGSKFRKVRDYLTDEVVNGDVSFFLEEVPDIGAPKKDGLCSSGGYNSEIVKSVGNLSWVTRLWERTRNLRLTTKRYAKIEMNKVTVNRRPSKHSV